MLGNGRQCDVEGERGEPSVDGGAGLATESNVQRFAGRSTLAEGVPISWRIAARSVSVRAPIDGEAIRSVYIFGSLHFDGGDPGEVTMVMEAKGREVQL